MPISAPARENNELNGLDIQGGGGRFGVVQIAGFVARRIVCFVRQGRAIGGAGDQFGLIRFGSRVDAVYARRGETLGDDGARRSRARWHSA